MTIVGTVNLGLTRAARAAINGCFDITVHSSAAERRVRALAENLPAALACFLLYGRSPEPGGLASGLASRCHRRTSDRATPATAAPRARTKNAFRARFAQVSPPLVNPYRFCPRCVPSAPPWHTSDIDHQLDNTLIFTCLTHAALAGGALRIRQ